jgi:hypothetical protein
MRLIPLSGFRFGAEFVENSIFSQNIEEGTFIVLELHIFDG